MWICLTLSLLGFVLVFLEFFLPGGLIVILGGLFLIAGVTYFSVLGLPFYLKALYFLATAVGTALSCKSAIWVLRHRNKGELLLSGNQSGYVAATFEESFIGQQAIASSDLKPAGFIYIGEKKFPALSDEGYLVKGAKVTILRGQGNSYIVREDK